MSLQIPHLGLMLLRNLCRNTRRNGWLDESNAKTFNEIKALFGSNNGFDHGAYPVINGWHLLFIINHTSSKNFH